MVQRLRREEVPLVVVSGGIKAIIDAALEHCLGHAQMMEGGDDRGMEYEDLLQYYNVKVLSNEFRFVEKEGFDERIVDGYNEQKILHSMNKKEFVNEIAIDDIRDKMRPNVILLGDIIEDCEMVDK